MASDPTALRAAYVEEHPDQDPDELQQMNVRIPRWLVWTLDQRRGRLELSRDKWVARALRFVLAQPGNPARGARTVARTSSGRTIKPGSPR